MPVLLVTVIVALPVPEPEQLPLAVMLTGKPELAVAATGKVSPNSALPGAGVVTVMVCGVKSHASPTPSESVSV